MHVSLSGKWSWSTVTLASLFGQDRPAESPALKAPGAEDLLFSDLHISKKLAKLLRLSEVSDRVKDMYVYVCMYVCMYKVTVYQFQNFDNLSINILLSHVHTFTSRIDKSSYYSISMNICDYVCSMYTCYNKLFVFSRYV